MFVIYKRIERWRIDYQHIGFIAIYRFKIWIYNHVTLSYQIWQTCYVVLTHSCTDPFNAYTLGEEGQHRTVTLYVRILGLYTAISVI